MSTIKTETLSTPSNATVPVDTVVNGTAKAWVNFNGTGTVAIRRAFNVASITDNGTGDYTVNFTTAMPDANYCFQANGYTSKTFNENNSSIVRTTTAIRMATRESSSNAFTDPAQVSVAIFS
jgi:hypothetical protein